MKAQLSGIKKCKPGWNGIINILLCFLLPPTTQPTPPAPPRALQLNSLIYCCSSGMRRANWLSDTALNFLHSPGGNSYSRSFSVTPAFLGPCREHTNPKMISLGGATCKATAALAQNKSSVALRDSREACQGLQEVLAMHNVSKEEFGSKLIEITWLHMS